MRIETEVSLAKLAQLKSAFDRLPKVIQRKIVREETRDAAKKHLLPRLKVETPKRTGRLRRALAVRAIKKSRSKAGVRMALTSTKFKQGGKAGTAWRGVIPFYAGFLEYGWRIGKRTSREAAIQKAVRELKAAGMIEEAKEEAKRDKREKVEGKEFMKDVAKRYGDIATESAANEMAKRIVEEFRKL